jgi:hypothetical protein
LRSTFGGNVGANCHSVDPKVVPLFPGHAVWTSAAGWCVSSVMTWVRRHCLDIQPHHYVYTPPVSSGGWQPLPGNTAAVAAVYWVQVSVGCPDCRACRHSTYSSGCCSCECRMVVLNAGPSTVHMALKGARREGGREGRRYLTEFWVCRQICFHMVSDQLHLLHGYGAG